MKKMMVITVILGACFMADAANIAVNNGEDDTVTFAPPTKKGARVAMSSPYLGAMPMLAGKSEIRIASLPALTSPNLAVSRQNAMAGLMGVNVSMDRRLDPAAWYLVPDNSAEGYGLQCFDFVVTSEKTWLGTALTNLATSGEHGHRLVVHCSGAYPVSAYLMRIESSFTNIPAVEYRPAMNGTNENPFSDTFVGVWYGPNEKPEFTYDPATGRVVAYGDDKVYRNLEKPSEVTYNWWYRFGGSVNINGTVGDILAMKAQCAQSNHWIKATMTRSGAAPVSQTVSIAIPRINIRLVDSKVRLRLQGGQEIANYRLQIREKLESGEFQDWLPEMKLQGNGLEQELPYVPWNTDFWRCYQLP